MTKGYVPKMEDNPPVKGEIYKHYKGDLYQVVGLAIHSNDDIWMVIYKPLYENADAELFARPLNEWRNIVTWEGKESERFTLVK